MPVDCLRLTSGVDRVRGSGTGEGPERADQREQARARQPRQVPADQGRRPGPAGRTFSLFIYLCHCVAFSLCSMDVSDAVPAAVVRQFAAVHPRGASRVRAAKEGPLQLATELLLFHVHRHARTRSSASHTFQYSTQTLPQVKTKPLKKGDKYLYQFDDIILFDFLDVHEGPDKSDKGTPLPPRSPPLPILTS